jgi:hypothetical protein
VTATGVNEIEKLVDDDRDDALSRAAVIKMSLTALSAASPPARYIELRKSFES